MLEQKYTKLNKKIDKFRDCGDCAINCVNRIFV